VNCQSSKGIGLANPIILKKGINLGSADAESDSEFLAGCYVDAGYMDILEDTSNSQCIVLGRTGAGKTALLTQFRKGTDHVREIAPETLSLNYITNSNVLQFFEEAGVHLDLYYKLLWEHIIAVELLKLKFEIYNESRQKDFLSFVGNFLARDKQKERALKYLQDWGSKFWEESEYRVKEFTRKLEDSLRAEAGASASGLNFSVGGASSLSEEQKADVITHGRRVVNKVQIDDLHQIINLLKEDVFHDKQNRYYLVIDRLDENWVEDRIKLKLLRALIDAVRAFRQVQNVKVIVGLRYDLLHSVLAKTLGPGFQTEKYVSLYLPLKWSRDDLGRILDQRVKFMFKRQYSGQHVDLADILPSNQMSQRKPLDYILDRTFLRPREAILFMNECIRQSAGQARINTTTIRQAESAYSQKRLTSLCEEWSRPLPNLGTALRNLLHRALARLLIRPPAHEPAAMPHPPAGDVIG
jgi:hypothetical protein